MRTLGLLALSTLSAAAGTSSPRAIQQVTFSRDVLPILQNRCQVCHRPGEAGPMSFLTYKDTRPWAKAIREAVLLKKMPPWNADPRYGKFLNDWSLTQREIDTLAAWADGGAREGDPKDAPKAREFLEGWTAGKPDMVFEMPLEFAVPAAGTIDYQHFLIPTRFTEDRWVEVAQLRAGNRSVVHHAVVFVRPPQSNWLREAKPGEPFVPNNWQRGKTIYDEILDVYVPGGLPQILKPGRAKLIKAGSDIIIQMHYTANGKAATDRSRIGLTFAKQPPTERVFTLGVMNGRFVIPPGDPDYRADAKMRLQESTNVLSMAPHMHLRGKSFEFLATYPDGRTETLLSVPHYSFNWQLNYIPAQPIPLLPGTLIQCTARWDNSPNNPNNPDASAEVRWGDQSWQEMLVGFMDVTLDPKMDPIDLFRPKKTGAPGFNSPGPSASAGSAARSGSAPTAALPGSYFPPRAAGRP